MRESVKAQYQKPITTCGGGILCYDYKKSKGKEKSKINNKTKMSHLSQLLKIIAQSKLLLLLRKKQIFELIAKFSEYDDNQIYNAIQSIQDAEKLLPVLSESQQDGSLVQNDEEVEKALSQENSNQEKNDFNLLSQTLKQFKVFKKKQTTDHNESASKKYEQKILTDLMNSLNS